MNVPYVLIAPALLTATTVAYALAGPAAGLDAGGRSATAPSETPATASRTATTPSSPPTAAPTPNAPDALPPGLTGRLTYRTGRTFVTVSLPSREAVPVPAPDIAPGDPSADGAWRVNTTCPDDTSCTLAFEAADGRRASVSVSGVLIEAHALWSPVGHTLAYAVAPPNALGARDLVVIDDPASPRPLVIARADGTSIDAFTWIADGRLLASLGGGAGGRPHLAAIGVDGTQRRLVDTVAAASYLYPSPDRRAVAFTQSAASGWHLYVYDTRDGSLRDLGNMGSDPAGTRPPAQVPPGEGKGPMYVAWSPDGAYLSFGGGLEPPYVMTTVDLAARRSVRTNFPDGYPGEIRWSPDRTRIAVSTYNIPRTHHESYVVDPATGAATDVLSGCVIVWSPDSRFLAIHGEKAPGVAIADVATLRHGQLTHTAGDAPVRWER